MQVDQIASITNVDARAVRAFLSRNKIDRHRKQGERGVFVNMDHYISVLRAKKYVQEAARLERELAKEA